MLRVGEIGFQGRARQLVIQYQMVSSKNIHTRNIQTEQVLLLYLGIYMHINIHIMKNEAMNLKAKLERGEHVRIWKVEREG